MLWELLLMQERANTMSRGSLHLHSSQTPPDRSAKARACYLGGELEDTRIEFAPRILCVNAAQRGTHLPAPFRGSELKNEVRKQTRL